MEIHFNGETHINESQFGDYNNMHIYNENYETILTEENWKELDVLLNQKLNDKTLNASQNLLIHNALGFIEKRDEKGFKAFLFKNKDNFLTNVLSNIVSSGLSILLNNLCS